ncbi:MAG TPA: molybdopterin-guanine dinucleotide biosynthesis protein B [Rhodocyclaceae bacterium]
MKIIGFAGWSGCGKTTLIEQVIGLLRQRGLTVSLIKHAHHNFEIDHAGKDSFRHRQAGCGQVLVTSARRWALMQELGDAPELTLDEALSRLAPCDLVLVEGFKYASIPKIEIYRAALGKPQLFPGDSNFIAVVSDTAVDTSLPQLDINQPSAVAEFIALTISGG